MGDVPTDIASEHFVGRWPAWLRWILFLPTAIAGSLIASILYNILIVFGGFFYGTDISDGYVFKLTSSAILGGVFVYAGAFIAPRHQFAVSILLLVLLTLILGFLFLLSFLPLSSVGPINYAVNALASLIAGGYVVYIFNEK